MNILILGGTGLIGRALCKALNHAGHELTVLSRKPETVPKKCGPSVKAIQSLTHWTPDLAFDAVINLAGEPIIDRPWTAARKQRLWDSRVTLTRQLVDCIAKATQKPKVLLSGSAIGYYGDTGAAVVDEAAGTAADFGAELCAAWEQAAQSASAHGVRVCLLRTGLVLAADGGLLGRMLLPFKIGLGARLGNGQQWMSWIYMDDYIGLLLRLLVAPDASGAFNMTAPQPVSNRQFTQTLAHVLHRPAFFAAPAWLLKFMLGQRAYLLLGGQRVLPTRAEALGYRFQFLQLETALRALIKGA